jgi:hypothetical protein
MDHTALLSNFQARVEQFRKLQGFIDRAREQSARFTAAVVEKVVRDNSEKQIAVVAELMPMTAELEARVAELRSERADAVDGVRSAQLRLEELDLRLAIGEIDEDGYKAEAGESKAAVSGVDERTSHIDEQLGALTAALDAWFEIGRGAGVIRPEAAETAAPAPTIEMGEIDLMGDNPPAPEEPSRPVPTPSVAAPEDDGASDRPRRAVLLYAEGTAEEQIYPFAGETLSLGRGRDNDIQVKNDSKVSRYHCKLYRRSGQFHVEDNKSANGTLVNGELITERRLFGGEEVIIGETFFRFRVLD